MDFQHRGPALKLKCIPYQAEKKNSETLFILLVYGILFISLSIPGVSQNRYVSNNGDNNGPGTIETPYKTIQFGVDHLSPGDTLFIIGGHYHEKILFDQKNGTEDLPIVITSYNNEKVILDGTIPIETEWSVYKGHIYKTVISEDIWQLFVDGRMQVIARWPNASTHPVDPFQRKDNSWEAVDSTWWSLKTTWANADAPLTENGVVENNSDYQDLAATRKNFTGGSILLRVLAQGGDGNQERPITFHEAGSNILTHPVLYPPKPDKAYLDTGKFFLIEHLEALDKEEEWYFIDSTNTVYLWAKENVNPNTLNIRGRNINRAFEITNSSSVKVLGINFFACNIAAHGDNITIQDCSFTYPDASKRLLGIYPDNSSVASEKFGTYINGTGFSLINCIVQYTEYSAISVINGTHSRIHNNLFRHLAILGLGKNGAIEQVNSYTRNTFNIAGNRGAVKANTDPVEGRNQSYNYFNGFGFLQVPDGASLQVATNKTPGTIRSYNWFTYSLKYGSRWDGKPAGIRGTNHHEVGLMVKGTLQVKGDDHGTYNNSSFLSQEQNGIIIMSDSEYGGNQRSRTHNNLADKIAGSRSDNIYESPLPGTHSHNWNGYIEQREASSQVYDIDNHDFRPRPGSDIIDTGIEIQGITDNYPGNAPDLGAYEFGDSVYWIPGYQDEIASMPVPLDGGETNYEFVDLMWLDAREAEASNVYFGNAEVNVENADPGSTEYRGRQKNNIFNPGALTRGKTYFWRIDAIIGNRLAKGKVWSFTAGKDANPEVFDVHIKIFGKSGDMVTALENCRLKLNEWQKLTDEIGCAEYSMIKEGNYTLVMEKENFKLETNRFFIMSDTLIIDTLEYYNDNIQVTARVKDRNNKEAVYHALVSSGDLHNLTDSEGITVLHGLESGEVSYFVDHNDYFFLSDSLYIYTDTSLNIWLTPLLANVTFSVYDAQGPVSDAIVRFGSYETSTFTSGEAYLFYLPARTEYPCSVEMEGYENYRDTLLVDLDTLLRIELLPATNMSGNDECVKIKFYPNPASDRINMILPWEAKLEVLGADGRILLEERVVKDGASIDLSNFEQGSYILRITSGEKRYLRKLLIIKNI